ncbi:MAG: hypothetical protein LC114_20750 [Bryobacterales bacterium]|nr:hypothetical protein [Bryobacterales bacterium]
MRSLLTARFLRVGSHLINLEVIQQVELRKDGSAMVVVPGPRKSLQRIEVLSPMGRELWDFFNQNLVVVDFHSEPEVEAVAPKKPKAKSKAPAPAGKKNAKPGQKPPKAGAPA